MSDDASATGGDARTLLVAGTASHVGKSTVVAGLCRRLADRGVSVAPFKAQNMSNNARAVPRPAAVRRGADAENENDGGTDADSDPAFGEVGVSQYVQARAARVRPSTDHNPVLLKPRGGGESQLVLDGRPAGHAAAGRYYDEYWDEARDRATAAHARLAAVHDVVVAEGAGSIAEVNLHHRDLANVETARFADASILLVTDIERGGAFAAAVGTLELMPDDLRDRVVGLAITKFRGDRSLLADGLTTVEARTGVPVLAVLPYEDPGLPEEDSVSLPAAGERGVRGVDDGVPDAQSVTVGVPRLPRASNVTDLEPLAREPGVRVAYLPLDTSLAGVDAVVVPGTKNTVDDLKACRAAGLFAELRGFDGPVVGLCGGYQLLGERITSASVEGTGEREDGVDGGDPDTVEGGGLLPVETRFSANKRVAPATWELRGCGPLASGRGTVEGYEIHAGETRATGVAETPFPEVGVSAGAARGDVLGTYLHGLFENRVAREAFLDAVYDRAGRERPANEGCGDGATPFDRAAALASEIPLGALGIGVGGSA